MSVAVLQDLRKISFRPPGVCICRPMQLKRFLKERPDCREGENSMHLGKGVWAFRIEAAGSDGTA